MLADLLEFGWHLHLAGLCGGYVGGCARSEKVEKGAAPLVRCRRTARMLTLEKGTAPLC